MEDEVNLLDGFNEQEFDLDAYRKSYFKHRLIAIISGFAIYFVWLYIAQNDESIEDKTEFAIGAALLLLSVPFSALLVAILLANFKKPDIPFIERLKKTFWMVSVWFNGFLLFISASIAIILMYV